MYQRQYADNTPIFVPVPSLTLWSWSNFTTARYGASKYPMPLSIGPNGLAETARLLGKSDTDLLPRLSENVPTEIGIIDDR